MVVSFKELFLCVFFVLSSFAVAFESFHHSDLASEGNTPVCFCPHLSQSFMLLFDYAFFSDQFSTFVLCIFVKS